jgi:hypothetical protein
MTSNTTSDGIVTSKQIQAYTTTNLAFVTKLQRKSYTPLSILNIPAINWMKLKRNWYDPAVHQYISTTKLEKEFRLKLAKESK